MNRKSRDVASFKLELCISSSLLFENKILNEKEKLVLLMVFFLVND